MEKQISIIIPTYNMEKYIGKCLDSLLIPEFDQVEVLVVNDGSKDRSSEIAHSYADRYPGSIRVVDKPNGNYGSCINAALPLATGRYVKVLDADDTFDTEAFSELVKKLKSSNDDAIITNHVTLNSDGDVIGSSKFIHISVIDKSIDIRSAYSSVADIYVEMHRIAYKREIFNRFRYHQTEGVSYSDSQWAIIPLAHCQTVKCINLCVYKYLLGREGQTMDDNKIASSLSQFFVVLNDTVRHYCNSSVGGTVRMLMLKHLIQVHEFVYYTAMRYSGISTVLKKHDEWIKEFATDVYDAIGSIQYHPMLTYCIFKDIRIKGYPTKFKLPLWVRIQIFLKSRFNFRKSKPLTFQTV